MTNDMYEVTRADYQAFVRGLNKDKFIVEKKKTNRFHYIIKMISKATNKCLCGRVYDIREDSQKRDPEKYYIYEMPTAEESVPPIPVMQLKLQNYKEVQAFFDYTSKRNKEHEGAV